MGLVNFVGGILVVSGKESDVLAIAGEMTRKNIPFNALTKNGDGSLVFRTPYKYEKELLLVFDSQSAHLDVKLIGLPHLLSLYKKRIGLFAGAAVVLLSVLFSNAFILSFDVVGNERLSDEYVLSLLASQGLKAGTLKKSHDLRMIALNAELSCDDIAWLSVNISGTRATVELRETVKKPQGYNEKAPTDIVAKCDGQIIYTEALSGSVVVNRHDVVKAGDLLISGVVDSKAYGYKLVKSYGKVLAKTYRSFSASITLKTSEKEYTGRKKTVKSISVFGKSIIKQKPYGGFENYDVTEKKEELCFFGSVRLPITAVSCVYEEYVPKPKTLTKSEAREKALAEISDMIASEISGKILERTESEKIEDGKYVLSVALYCIEDISREKPIDKAWGYVIE